MITVCFKPQANEDHTISKLSLGERMKRREMTANWSNSAGDSMSQESETEDRAYSFHPAAPRGTVRHVECHTLCNERFPDQALRKPQLTAFCLGCA